MIDFKGRHFEREMILQSVRWYLAYSLSYRDNEVTMKERGFEVSVANSNFSRPNSRLGRLAARYDVLWVANSDFLKGLS